MTSGNFGDRPTQFASSQSPGRWTRRYAEKLPPPSAVAISAKPSASIARSHAAGQMPCMYFLGRWSTDQHIVVGDVSTQKLVKTRMAKSVLDSGWGTLKRFLAYKCEYAARSFEVTDERYSTVTCSNCGAVSGPRGVNGLIVRFWVCSSCGELHDRDVNSARNTLIGSRCWSSVRRNELSYSLIRPSNAYRVREAGIESARTAA